MTDLPVLSESLPGRLGATARIADGELLVELEPHAAVLRHGVVRTSVLSYLVDCVAGIQIDQEGDEAWTLTSDMTVRALPIPAPRRVSARFRLLRRGNRSATGTVDLRADDGVTVGTGAIGFTRVAWRDGDPPRPHFSLEDIVARFSRQPAITEPLVDSASIEIVDAVEGVVEAPLTNTLRNTAGTLQGAMTALIAEVAAEEALSARSGRPVVVTDLDLRYLVRTRDGPIRTHAEVLGEGAEAPVVIEVVDESTDAVVALVHARGSAAG